MIRENFKVIISDFNQTDLEQILCTEKSDVIFSMNHYLSKIDNLLAFP